MLHSLKMMFALLIISALLSACSLEPDDPKFPTSMCYDINGDTLTVMCLSDSYESCLENDARTLGTYDDYEACSADTDEVLANWAASGTLQAGSGSEESTGSASGSDGSGGSGGAEVGTYKFTFVCSQTGQSHTVDVPNDSCASHSEYLAEVYGCNLIDEMGQACRGYYGCLGQDTSVCP